MNCNCDFPARYLINRDGKSCFTCGLGRCRFYALAPVQCDGYMRVTLGAPGCPAADTGVVLRFEALVHPDHSDVEAFTVHVQGDPQRWETVRREVLQDPQFEGAWYTTARAFLYPMSQYSRLVHTLKARPLPNTALEEIPGFYFRCVERLRQIPQQYAQDVAAGRARLPDPDDCVFRQLKPFQKEGVRFVLARQGRAMIADDMGLGKTVQALAVAHHYRDEWPVLVVCPMSLLENWAKEFNKFCGIPYTRIAILQGTKARASTLQDVVIVSYSSLKCVEEAHFNVVILDESHYIKAAAAKRAQLSLKICRDSRRVLLLSGTPAVSRPIELYAQLQAIQPTNVPSKSHFGARYCNSYVSRFGIDLSGHSHTDELHSLLQHYVIRRTKKQLGNELPSKSRQLLYVYITDKEKKALEKQVVALRRCLAASSTSSSSAASLLNGGRLNADFATRAPNAFEMKMATARAKIPAVQDYVGSIVEQHLDSGEKLILFAHHQCMMEALKTAVEAVRPRQPIDYIYISGDTPASQREPAAEHFRTEPTCTVAILSMQSSGTGHNFTCASTVVFTELDWNPGTHLQCEDRVHRIGQAQPCHIKYLLADGTADSVIWPLLQTKLSVTTAMFENTGRAAEVHLYDGADKQNVARRNAVTAVAAAASTPSSSQQSTLDRFLPPPSPSRSMTGEEDTGGSAAHSPTPTPRPSVHSQACPSTVLSPRCDDMEASGGMVRTPTGPAQHQPDSLMGSPLSLTRGSCSTPVTAGVVATPARQSLVVSFAEMGNAYADAIPKPRKHGAPHSSSFASAPWTATTTTHNDAFPSHVNSPPTVASISVLDLMRQTSSKPPPKMSSDSVCAAATKTAASVNPAVVVDLTDTTAVTSYTGQELPKQAATQPLIQPFSPASHVVVPFAWPSVVAASGTAVTPASRRTVFTLGSASNSATAATSSNPTNAPTVSSTVMGATLPPVSVAQPITPQPSTPRPVALDVPFSGSSNNTAPAASSTSNNVGTVRIPLRPNLHFKRPRSDVEVNAHRGTSASDNTHNRTVSSGGASASIQNSYTYTERHQQSAAGPPPSSSTLLHHPVSAPHPVMLAASSAGSLPSPACSAATVLTAPSAAAPRRTLFKLVRDGRQEQLAKKD